MDYDSAFADLNKALVDLDGDGKPDAPAPRAKLGANRLEPGEVSANQPQDESTWLQRLAAFVAGGGPMGQAQPGQRGTWVPSQINAQGKPELAVPGVIQQPAESLQSLMTAPLSDIVRSGDRDAIRAAAEASFDVAGALPAAGAVATKGVGAPAVSGAGVASQPKPSLTWEAIKRHGRAWDKAFPTAGDKFDQVIGGGAVPLGLGAPFAGAMMESSPATAAGIMGAAAVGSMHDHILDVIRIRNHLSGLRQKGLFSNPDDLNTSAVLAALQAGNVDEALAAANARTPAAPPPHLPNPAAAEASFDVAGALPAAGAAVTKAAPRSKAMGMVAAATPDDPTTAAAAAALTAQERPKGIKAYHGSPHDFDRFDLSKIGTGEGAQAYGHGLYFAENERVAQSYRDNLGILSQPPPRMFGDLTDADLMARAENAMSRSGYDPARGAARIRNEANFMKNNLGHPDLAAKMLEIADKTERGELTFKPPGRMYEVNINASPEDFLDWDKPLGKQGEVGRKAARVAGPVEGDPLEMRGHWRLTDLMEKARDRGGQREDVSKALREAGIPGIRYLDQGSRTAGEGSRNYVVFDDKLIDILRKYSNAPDPNTAAILAILAAQQGGQQQP